MQSSILKECEDDKDLFYQIRQRKKKGNLLSSLPDCQGKEVAFIKKVMHRDRNKLPEP